MKKLLILIIISVFITGCSNDKEEVKATDDYLYFLYATPLADHSIWLQSKQGFDQACKELKIKGDWIGPTVIDTAEMEEVIAQGIIQKVDGIITQGVIAPDLVNQAMEANIPIALVDSNVEGVDKFAFYGKNFHTQAELFLAEIEKSIGKEEKMYIAIQAAELNFKIAQDQIDEINNVFKNHPGGYEIVSVTESKSDKVKAQSEWMSVLKKYPQVNVSINFAAESADACGEIAHTLNIKDRLHIYGVDDMDSTINYIKKGWVDASIVTSFYEYGYKTVYQMYEYKKHGILPDKKENDVKLLVVNKDNVNNYKEELKNEK